MGKIKKENKNYELYLPLSQLNYICNFSQFSNGIEVFVSSFQAI